MTDLGAWSKSLADLRPHPGCGLVFLVFSVLRHLHPRHDVYLFVLDLMTWLQPAPSAGAGGGGGAAGGPPNTCAAGGMNIGLLAVMFIVFYFFIIRPQQKRQRETEAMLNALRKGMVVRTTGGIRGEIVDLDEATVKLKIADKTKIDILRSHIAGPEGAPVSEEK